MNSRDYWREAVLADQLMSLYWRRLCVVWTGGGWGIVAFLFTARQGHRVDARSVWKRRIATLTLGWVPDLEETDSSSASWRLGCSSEIIDVTWPEDRDRMLHLLTSGCQSEWAGTKGSGFSALAVSLLLQTNLVHFCICTICFSTTCMQWIKYRLNNTVSCGHHVECGTFSDPGYENYIEICVVCVWESERFGLAAA